MFKMSKIKLLILAITLIEPRECNSERDYTDIFIFNDTYSTYETRMNEKGLPLLGESYEDFEQKNKNFKRSEYKILMDSIPIIYETQESVKKRNKSTQGLQQYEIAVFDYINQYYPKLYESYEEYEIRIAGKVASVADYEDTPNPFLGERAKKTLEHFHEGQSSRTNENNTFTFTRSMCRGLKRIFPNVGENYTEYMSRMEEYGVTGLSSKQYLLFLTFIPKQHEYWFDYLNRIREKKKNNELKDWNIIFTVEFYTGIKRLIPQLGETYNEYSNRMTELDLSTMTLGSFNEFQKFYPQLYEDFNEYTARNKEANYLNHNYLYILDNESFSRLKMRIPLLFENLEDYIIRLNINTDDLRQNQEFYNARRIHPKLSESYADYCNRIKDLGLDILLENKYFLKFKTSYPQIDYIFEKSTINYVDDTEFEQKTGLFLDENKFEELKARMPLPFGVYPYYKDKMLRQKIKPLEEDNFEDFKKVFIRQSEKYEDYTIRMKLIGIRPMSNITVILFKQTVPREWIESYDAYKNEEYYFNISKIILFDEIEHSIFKQIAPMPFECYSTYTSRVKNKLLIEVNNYEKYNEYRTPLNEEEFRDLKLRYPKLNEKFNDYSNRLKLYLTKPIISDLMFNNFKQTLVQIGDDYEKYNTRISSIGVLGQSNFNRLSKHNFDLFKSRIPFSFDDNYSSYAIRHGMTAFYEDEYDDYLNIYPKYYSTFDEYLHFMNDLVLVPVSKDYLKQLKLSYPNFYESDYEEYKLKMEKLNLPSMTNTQFHIFKLKTPKPYEGSVSYETRVKNLYPGTQNLENVYSLSIRIFPQLSNNYEEYIQHMELLCIEPMDINYFKSYKSYFPEHDEDNYFKYCNRLNESESQNSYLSMVMKPYPDTSESSLPLMTDYQYEVFKSRLPSVHERYNNYKTRNIVLGHLSEYEFNDLKYQFSLSYENHVEHVQRMKNSFRKPLLLEKFLEEKSMRVLIGEKYSEHYTKIIKKYSQQIKNDTERSHEEVVNIMKSLGVETLDKSNFIEHMLTYPFNYGSFENHCLIMNQHNWKGTPVVTEIWYSRMKAFVPKMCDTFDDYKTRAKIYGFPDITEIQFERLKNGLPAPGESINDFLKRINTISATEPFMRTLHLNFTLLSPKFNDNYPAYTARVQQYGEPINLLEFNCFMEYLPKLGDDLITFNNKIKLSGFPDLNLKAFIALKSFFPRIYHFTYDNYLLDIGLNHSDMNVVNSLKWSNDEFIKYKRKFPRQFEFYYAAYCDRTTKERITEVFNKEEFEIFKAANFPLPHENYHQHTTNMQSQGFNSIPKDVFYFFKNLYPVLFEQTYPFRSREIVPQLLNQPNYDEPMYTKNMTKDLVKEIINRSNPYQELMNKIENLMPHIMDEKQFEEFTMSFPKLFESYSAYKLSMLETTYFPPIDETYDQYIERMEKLKNNQHLDVKKFNEFTMYFSFGVVSQEECICMTLVHFDGKSKNNPGFYLQLINNYFPKVYEVYSQYKERITFLEHNHLGRTEYEEFVKCFPTSTLYYSAYKPDSECTVYFTQIDKDYKDYQMRLKKIEKEGLSKNVYDKKKKNYFSSFYKESFEDYTARTKNYAINYMLPIDFMQFKKDFPSVFKPYDEFKENLKDASIMSKEQYILLTNAYFPPIYENVAQYMARMNVLKDTIMSKEEFKEFTINFPLISKSYYAYKSCLQRADRPQKARIGIVSYEEGASRIIDEKLFNSIKTAYFPKVNETYAEYNKRSVSIGFTPLTEKLFRNCVDVYPQPSKYTFKTYKNNFFENLEPEIPRGLNYDSLTGMKNIGCVPLNFEAHIMFGQNVPKVLQTYDNYLKYVSDKDIILMFNEEQFESVKDVHYPRLSENFRKYLERMQILGMEPITLNIFNMYKLIYPNFFDGHATYIHRIKTKLNNDNILSKLLEPHMLNKEEFDYYSTNGPRLVENYKMYLKRRNKEMLSTDNKFGVHSYHMYNQLKNVFMPDRGETIDEYETFIKSLSFIETDDYYQIEMYYTGIMQLYPQFFESYKEYLERTQNSILEHLRLTETEFNLYFSSLPRPFESYRRYLNRRKGEEYVLTKKQFVNYQQLYPRIPETLRKYNERLVKLKHPIIRRGVHKYFKRIYPTLDDSYLAYSKRFEIIVGNMLERRENEAESIKKEEVDFLVNILKVTHMTKEEFKSFMLSLPKPNEDYKNYTVRVELIKLDQLKDVQFPFTESQFKDIKLSYPNAEESTYEYNFRLKSYDYIYPVQNKNYFLNNFEELITESLGSMFWNYVGST